MKRLLDWWQRKCTEAWGELLEMHHNPTLILEPKMTDKEVMEALRSDAALNKARAVFSSESAKIEQAGMQRRPAGPIEIRRMEFEAVRKIAAVLGVEV